MKIALLGYGTMGKIMLEKIEKSEDIECIGIISRQFYENLEDIPADVEAIIDYSYPKNLAKITNFVLAKPMPVILGVTGYTETQKRQIEQLSKTMPVVAASNFAMGMQLMIEMLDSVKETLKKDYDIEIFEMHQKHKKDIPSGTAIALKDVFRDHSVKNRYGKQPDIPIHSIRRKSLFPEHTVMLVGEEEVLTLTHRVSSREIYAQGTLRALRWVRGKGPGLYTMEDIMKEDQHEK